jgi:hypothetical protein
MNLLKLNNFLHTFESDLVKLAQERAEKSFFSDSELEQKTLIEESLDQLLSQIGAFNIGIIDEMPSNQQICFTISRYLSVSGYGVEY